MWLTRQLASSTGIRLRNGQVEGGGEFAVQGEVRFRQPEQLFPYGFASAAAGGRQAVMLDGYCAGLSATPDTSLAEGEVRLYSAGGAEILLKNDGAVVINGQVFEPKEAV